jgi:DsbC/DsbD-like thiol-disulfide interchange protein
MGRLRYWLMTWIAALLLAAPAHAANNIAASLVPESRTVAPGTSVTLALVMKPKPTWHGYWKNPGDSGIETAISWQLPPGVQAGPLQYPVPHRLVIADLMNYVYKGDYAQLVELSVPAGIAPGTRLPLRARVDYLACTDEICVPESAEVAVELEAGPAGARDPAFEGYRQALPKPLGSDGRFALAGNRFRLAVPIPAALDVSDVYFYPLTDGALAYAAPQKVSRNGDTLIVETDAAGQAGTLQAVEGVLRIGEDQGLSLKAVPGPVPASGAALAPQAEASGQGTAIVAALAGALIGGLLLNIMPCVFPILSLKALSLAKAGGNEGACPPRSTRLHRRRGAGLRCAWRRPAWAPGRRGGRGLGLPAPGSPRHPVPAAAGHRDRAQSCWPVRIAQHRRPASPRQKARRAPSGPGVWPPLSPRPAPARSWARPWAQPWCCRHWPHWPSLRAWDWGSPCPSCCSALCRPSDAACPVRAPGWSASAGSCPCRCS